MYVFKPKRTKSGKRWTSQYWSGRYKLADDANWTTVSLKVRQRDVAERKLAEIVHREERRRQGMLTDEAELAAAGRPLLEHLDEFERDLQARNRSKGYIRKLIPRCRRVMEECGWVRIGDVNADSFISWRASATFGPRTANHYLESMRCFLEWMACCGRITTNPLLRVQKSETRGHERVVRRAYTLEELRRLLAVSDTRMPIYLGAALTGLRFRELGQLCCGDLDLESEQPVIRLPASIQKTPEYKVLPLAPEVAAAWSPLVSGRSANARLFAKGMPSHKTLARDLERAGIAKRDARGRTVDFHSFRMTFTTFLQVAGVDRRLVMEVARHKDSRLTDLVYTDAERLDLRGAVNSLPVLLSESANAQENAHGTVPIGHNQSSTVTCLGNGRGAQNRGSQDQKPRFRTADGAPCTDSKKWSRGELNPRPATVSMTPLRVCPQV